MMARSATGSMRPLTLLQWITSAGGRNGKTCVSVALYRGPVAAVATSDGWKGQYRCAVRWNSSSNDGSTSTLDVATEAATSTAAPSISSVSNGASLPFDATVVAPDAERLPILPYPPLPPAPTHNNESTTTRSKKSTMWWHNLAQRYTFSGQMSKIRRGESLFQAAKQHSMDPRWFGPGRIPRDFRSRHAVLTFHVWLLHKRLLADTVDTNQALSVDEELFYILWDDTTCRIRQAGVSELAVNKHLLQVQQYTFVHLTHYDHCYTEHFLLNPVDRLLQLRQLVWLHWFQSHDSMEHCTDHLDRICWYIDANYRNIMLEWPDALYRESLVQWTNLPDFTGMVDANGVTMPHQDVFVDDVVTAPWLRNITNRGVEYYWNPDTGAAQYEKPV